MESFAWFKELSVLFDLFAANGVDSAAADMGLASIEQYLLYLPFPDSSGGHSGAGVVGKDNF